jgi:hypothetical protein
VILELAEIACATLAGARVSRVVIRSFQLRNDVMRGKQTHEFEAKVVRDIHMGRVKTRFCDVCNRPRKAYIHFPKRDEPVPELTDAVKIQNRIHRLELADVEWRFQNDPEWVKVFGHEYDPETFERIPEHNGECGGPHDSCPRCAWEADKRDREESRKRQEAKEKSTREDKERREQEAKVYIDLLWTIWNTVHSPEDAVEEFSDLEGEIGMLKSDAVRREIKTSDIYPRLDFLFSSKDYANRWHKREELWANKMRADAAKRCRY